MNEGIRGRTRLRDTATTEGPASELSRYARTPSMREAKDNK